MKKIILTLILLVFLISKNYSQRILTLEESINIALKQSYNMKSSNQSLQSSIKSLEATKMGMLSRVDLSIDAPSFNRNLASQFNPLTGLNEFYQVGETRWQGNLSISQPLIFSNGTVSIIGSLFGRDQYSQIQATKPDYFSNIAIQLRQPLLTVNTQKLNLHKAEMNLEKTESSFTKTQMDIIFDVTQSFYNLFQTTRQLEINVIDVKQREDAFNTAERKFKSGLVPEVEMLQLEVELSSGKNEYMQRQRSLTQAKNSFKVLIGLPLDEKIDVIPELEYSPITIDSLKAIKLAVEKSVDLNNSKVDRELQDLNIQEINSQRSFRADITANYGLNKSDESFNGLYRDLSQSRSIVLTLSLPIWDWGSNRLAVEAAEANLHNTELSIQNKEILIKQDILDLLYRIELAKSRIKVVKRGLEVAQKSFGISLERYRSGQIKSDEFVLEQKRFTNAKQEDLNAIIDYKIAIADLKRKTFYDFEKDQPIKMINKFE